MNSPEIKRYIKKRSNLFWHIPESKKEDVSTELLIETIFNYGTLDDTRELFNLLGIGNVANVFFSLRDRKKQNYYPEIYNFFSLVLKKHVQRSIDSPAN